MTTSTDELVEYECPDCHRMGPSQAARDGCCTWDDA